MGKLIGYGKIGRSMPLTLAKCGTLGGDVEMVAVVAELARRRPDDTFVLMGRNSGEDPVQVGLPSNIHNPWTAWGPELRKAMDREIPKGVTLSVESHIKLRRIFDDITGPMFEQLDDLVLWVGQHGTTNTALPGIRDQTQLTNPQDWCAFYSSFLMQGVNRWRDTHDPYTHEEIYLNADARNSHKMRDLKWPLRHPILAQYDYTKNIKHHRYGDERIPHVVPLRPDGSGRWSDVGNWTSYQTEPFLWTSQTDSMYSRLEINALFPGTPFGDLIDFNFDWDRPGHFGIFINEAGALGNEKLRRRTAMRDWVLPLEPYFMHGNWSEKSRQALGIEISPAPWDAYFPALHSVRTTLTTPSSCSGWATTKPWEMFAAGTVCFFHPDYDTQNHILADAPPELNEWLRVKDLFGLKQRVRHLNSLAGRADWEMLVGMQRHHFKNAIREGRYLNMINDRIDAK